MALIAMMAQSAEAQQGESWSGIVTTQTEYISNDVLVNTTTVTGPGTFELAYDGTSQIYMAIGSTSLTAYGFDPFASLPSSQSLSVDTGGHGYDNGDYYFDATSATANIYSGYVDQSGDGQEVHASFATVPEPASIGLMATGAIAITAIALVRFSRRGKPLCDQQMALMGQA
jgi:hypothetical protein